jgi:hypothetical protein
MYAVRSRRALRDGNLDCHPSWKLPLKAMIIAAFIGSLLCIWLISLVVCRVKALKNERLSGRLSGPSWLRKMIVSCFFYTVLCFATVITFSAFVPTCPNCAEHSKCLGDDEALWFWKTPLALSGATVVLEQVLGCLTVKYCGNRHHRQQTSSPSQNGLENSEPHPVNEQDDGTVVDEDMSSVGDIETLG